MAEVLAAVTLRRPRLPVVSNVDAAVWFQIRDELPQPSYPATYQSGLYFNDGRAKPAARAFRFPFVVVGRRVWGKAPHRGVVTIERRVGGRYRRLRLVRVGRSRIFYLRLHARRGNTLRARRGGATSLPFKIR